MPQLSKVEARALIRQLIDDPAGKLWSTTNLDQLIEGVLDELWGELLDQFSWLRSDEELATIVAPGYVDLAEDPFVRYYRVQQVTRSGILYRPADQRDVLVENGVVVSAPEFSYTIFGSQLHMFPYSETADVYIRYSSLPEPFTSLSPGPDPDDPQDDDISFIEWPDGYHLAYVYDVASRALEKGDREDSSKLGRRAEASLFRLKAFLRRHNLGPTMPYIPDDGLNSV